MNRQTEETDLYLGSQQDQRQHDTGAYSTGRYKHGGAMEAECEQKPKHRKID